MDMTLDQQMDLLRRGAEEIFTEDELRKKLSSGKQLRIKLGMDPTAPDIHLGHSVVLRKMRQFQDLGHKAVLIIGDYTAMIGDPSGRDSTRPMIDEATVTANAQTYLDQAGLILDTSPDKLEVRRNSEWLGKLTFADTLRLTGSMTVQQMLQRENFKLRMRDGREIVVTEFLYPLMQAYDSVVIDADVELGGTDQTFNNLAGRDLMAKHDKPRQVVMTFPLLAGLDGSDKMSKSKGNYIGLTEPANEMFGKVMSIPDALMSNYFTLLTDRATDQIAKLVDGNQTHPRDAKDELGRMIVAMYHDEAAATGASEEFRRRFAEGQLPSDMDRHEIAEATRPLADLIVQVGFASSKNEARRLIKQGAVTFADQKQSDPMGSVDLSDEPAVLKVGKRRVCEVVGSRA